MNAAADPLAALWRPPALMGVVLGGEALAAILALAPTHGGERLVHFGLASLGIQWVALGTLCALYLLRRPLGRLPPPRLAWACLALFLLMSLLVAAAAWSVLVMTANAEGTRTGFILRMLGLALVVGLIGLLSYQNYWRSRQWAVRAKQLELEALQARIHPHFLFNSLNTIAALTVSNPALAEEVVQDLAELFRVTMRDMRERVTLQQELDFTRSYLRIEAQRLGGRLLVDWTLKNLPLQAHVPALILQPLVENAVYHGIEPSAGGGRVHILGTYNRGVLRLEVRNPLPAQPARRRSGTGNRMALDNIRERLMLFYDLEARLETEAKEGLFRVTIRLPYRKGVTA